MNFSTADSQQLGLSFSLFFFSIFMGFLPVFSPRQVQAHKKRSWPSQSAEYKPGMKQPPSKCAQARYQESQRSARRCKHQVRLHQHIEGVHRCPRSADKAMAAKGMLARRFLHDFQMFTELHPHHNVKFLPAHAAPTPRKNTRGPLLRSKE